MTVDAGVYGQWDTDAADLSADDNPPAPAHTQPLDPAPERFRQVDITTALRADPTTKIVLPSQLARCVADGWTDTGETRYVGLSQLVHILRRP